MDAQTQLVWAGTLFFAGIAYTQVGLVATFNAKKSIENRSFAQSATQNILIAFGFIVSAILYTITGIWSLITQLWTARWFYLFMFVMLGPATLLATQGPAFYQTIDARYTQYVAPWIQQGFLPLLNTLRLTWDVTQCWVAVTPFSISGFIVEGVHTTGTCAALSFQTLVDDSLDIFITFFNATLDWVYEVGRIDFNGEAVAASAATLVNDTLRPTFECACANTTFMTDIIVNTFTSRNMTSFVGYFTNIFIEWARLHIQFVLDIFDNVFLDGNEFTCSGLSGQDYIDCALNRPPKFSHLAELGCQATYSLGAWVDEIFFYFFSAFFDELGNVIAVSGGLNQAAVDAFINGTVPGVSFIVTAPTCAIIRLVNTTIDLIVHIDLVVIPKMDPSYAAYSEFIQPLEEFYVNTTDGVQKLILNLAGFIPAAYSPLNPVVIEKCASAIGAFIRIVTRIWQFILYIIQVALAFLKDTTSYLKFFKGDFPWGGIGSRFVNTAEFFYNPIYDAFNDFVDAIVVISEFWSEWFSKAAGFFLKMVEEFGTAFVQGVTYIDDFPDWYCTDFQLSRQPFIITNAFKFSASVGNVIRTLPGEFGISSSCEAIALPNGNVTQAINFLPFPTSTDPFCCLGGLVQSLIDGGVNLINTFFNIFLQVLKLLQPGACGSVSSNAVIISLESSLAEFIDTLNNVLQSAACLVKGPLELIPCPSDPLTPGGVANVAANYIETAIYIVQIFPRILLDILRVALYASSTASGPLIEDSRAMEVCGAMSESYRLTVGLILNVSLSFASLGDCVVPTGGVPIFGTIMDLMNAILGEGGVLLQCISTPSGVAPKFQDPYCTDTAGTDSGTRMCISLVLFEPIFEWLRESLSSGFGIFKATFDLVLDIVIDFIECAFNLFANVVLDGFVSALEAYLKLIVNIIDQIRNFFINIQDCFSDINPGDSFGSFPFTIDIYSGALTCFSGSLASLGPPNFPLVSLGTFDATLLTDCPFIGDIINTALVTTYNKRDEDGVMKDRWTQLMLDMKAETLELNQSIAMESSLENENDHIGFIQYFLSSGNHTTTAKRNADLLMEPITQFHIDEHDTWNPEKSRRGLILLNLLNFHYIRQYITKFATSQNDTSISHCQASYFMLRLLYTDPKFLNATLSSTTPAGFRQSIEQMTNDLQKCFSESIVAQIFNSDAAMFDAHPIYPPMNVAHGSSYSSYTRIAFLVFDGIQVFFRHWIPHMWPKLVYLFSTPVILYDVPVMIPREESWVLYARSTPELINKPEVVFLGDALERLMQHFFVLIENIKISFAYHPVSKHIFDMAAETHEHMFHEKRGLVPFLYKVPDLIEEGKQAHLQKTKRSSDDYSILDIAMENWDQLMIDTHLKERHITNQRERDEWEAYLVSKTINEQYQEAHPFRKMKIIFNQFYDNVSQIVEKIHEGLSIRTRAYSDRVIQNRRTLPLIFDYIAERSLSPRKHHYERLRHSHFSDKESQSTAVLMRHHGRLGDVPSYISDRTLKYHILMDHHTSPPPSFEKKKRSIFDEEGQQQNIKVEYFDEPYSPFILATTRREQVIKEYYAETFITPEDVINGNKSKQELWAEDICVNLPLTAQQERCADLECPIIVNTVVDIVAYICSCINLTADGINVIISQFNIQHEKIRLNRLWGYQFSTGNPEEDAFMDPDHKLLESIRFPIGSDYWNTPEWKRYSSKYVYYMRGHYDKLSPEQQKAVERQSFWSKALAWVKGTPLPKKDFILLDEFQKKRLETQELFNGKPLPLSKINPKTNELSKKIRTSLREESEGTTKIATRKIIPTPDPFVPPGFNLIMSIADVFNAFASWLTGRDVNIQNTFDSFLNFLVDSVSNSPDSIVFWGAFLFLPDCFIQTNCRLASNGIGLWPGFGIAILIIGLFWRFTVTYNIDISEIFEKLQQTFPSFAIFFSFSGLLFIIALALAYRWSPLCLYTGWYPYCQRNWLGAPWWLPRFPFCYTGGFPNCIADDIYSTFIPWDRTCINWNVHLPGLFPEGDICTCTGSLLPTLSPSFDDCLREIIPFNDPPYGFNDGLRNIFVLLEIYLPSVNNFLRTTSLIFFSWIRQIGWINTQLTFDFPTGEVPDAYISANWVTLPLVVIGVVTLVFFLTFLLFLIIVLFLLIVAFILILVQMIILLTNWVMNKTGGYLQDHVEVITEPRTSRGNLSIDNIDEDFDYIQTQEPPTYMDQLYQTATVRFPESIPSTGFFTTLRILGDRLDSQLKSSHKRKEF